MLPFSIMYFGSELFLMDKNVLLMILCACFTTVIGNSSFYMSSRYLPVGIASGVCLGFSTIFVMILDKIINNQIIHSNQYLFAMMIIFIVIMIGVSSNKKSFKELNVTKGIFYSMLFGIFLGSGYFLVGLISRQINPLIAGFYWEGGIGIIGFVIISLKSLIQRNRFHFEPQKLLVIGKAASPTILGTSFYAYATTIGPISIAAAILPLISVFTSIFAIFYLKEKLILLQWILVGVLVFCIAMLKL